MKIGVVLFMPPYLSKAFADAPDYYLLHRRQIKTVNYAYFDRVLDNLEYFSDDIKAALKDVDRGEGVVIVTDEAGHPYDVARKVAADWQDGKIGVISGANLPMMKWLMNPGYILEKNPQEKFKSIIDHAAELGAKAIIAETFSGKPEQDPRAVIGDKAQPQIGKAEPAPGGN